VAPFIPGVLIRILQAVAHVLNMSDPDHEAFVDSAADCLDALLTSRSLYWLC
jgi:hypothetical protein